MIVVCRATAIAIVVYYIERVCTQYSTDPVAGSTVQALWLAADIATGGQFSTDIVISRLQSTDMSLWLAYSTYILAGWFPAQEVIYHKLWIQMLPIAFNQVRINSSIHFALFVSASH